MKPGRVPLVDVKSWEEEWRTATRRKQRPLGGAARVSYGRVCLWLRLVCGHCDQRMVSLDQKGGFTPPRRVRCTLCGDESREA
jgi:hypothetical protein